MAANCVADGDYLGEYSQFFTEFVARVNPDDQLPAKVSGYDVNENELVGEVISVTLQYLNRIYCPSSLQSYITRLVIQAIKSTCKKQPEICGLRQQEKTYAPLKLMQAVTNEVNDICRRYLDNSRLALLPPPLSTPQVTVGAIRNARRKMEDRHMILHDLNTMFSIQDNTIVDYYAVFDGHGGQDAAAYCATHLHQYLVESEHYPTDPESALRDAFLTTDAQFITKSSTQKLNGGTTAVCALLINKKLYIAWVGDSMASLVASGNVKQLVNPHRPNRDDEKKRIHNMGGVVVNCIGVLRVNGFLSISRAIGDVPYKPYISGEPEIRCVTLDGTEDFLIIACDGLWDYVDQRTAALRVYRQVLQNPHDLKHVHQALLQSAKRAGSLDNITVIVVFLTPPIEIASRSNPLLTHQAPNGLSLNNMDPNNPVPSNKFKTKTVYIDELVDNDTVKPPFAQTDDFEYHEVCGKGLMEGSSNRNTFVQRCIRQDEYDYTGADIGPETDVDAGENVYDNNYPLAASSLLDPSPESEESPMETEKLNDDDRNDDNYSNRDNENVYPVDSAVDDVDNRVRPNDRDVCGADDETLRDNGDDDARVKTASTHTVVDDDESPPSPRATKPPQDALIVTDNVADSEDSEDEWDYYRVDPNKQESATVPIVADESRKDEEQSIQENPEFVVKDSLEVESPEVENDIKCEELVKDTSSELINVDISDEKTSNDLEKNQILLDLQEEKREEDNMDFQLNPEAAEFIPNLSPPIVSTKGLLRDFAISGSPLKQTQAMDDIPIPSQSEFDKEVCYRPKEIGEEFLHDEHTEHHNNSSQSMDISDISSTKAEIGDDESMMQAVAALNWRSIATPPWENTVNTTSMLEGEILTKDSMSASLTPDEFNAVLEKLVDLNAVHMLDDSSEDAEQVNTPSRSPEPNKDDILLSEVKNSTDVLRSSTPQYFQENLESSLSTISSEVSSEMKAPSLSATTQENSAIDDTKKRRPYIERDGVYKRIYTTPVGVHVQVGTAPFPHDDHKKKNFLIQDENNSSSIEDREEDEETTQSEESSKEEEKSSASSDCSQTKEESTESKIPKAIPDTTSDYLDIRDFLDVPTSYIIENSLVNKFLKPKPEIEKDTIFQSNTTSKSKTEDSQSNQPDDCMDNHKTENEDESLENFENRKEEVEKLCDRDDNDDNDVKPDSTTDFTTDLNQFNLMEKFVEDELQHKADLNQFDLMQNFVEDELQHKNEMPTETITLVEKPNEQEQADNKTTEFVPINDETLKEKDASECIPSKEGETEPQEITKVSLEDTATIDKSKEEITRVVEAPAAVVATLSPVKAKAATTTSAKRPTKTTMTKGTTVPIAKTSMKSTSISPSKVTTNMRTTATSPAQSIAKKSAMNITTRPKQLVDGSTKTAVSSANSKTTVTKTTTTRVPTTTATRTSASPRMSSSTTRSKVTTLSKVNNGTPIEKKSTMSGDAKSISKPATTKPTNATLKTTSGTKLTLVKTSPTTMKTSASGITRSRPMSATSTAKTIPMSKQSATGINDASRPRSAPISSGMIKLRENVKTSTATGKTTMTAKSPLIDKQSKETVNKQISRSETSTSKINNRASASIGATTGVTRTRTLAGKTTGNPLATSPTKKTLTSKTASKTSSIATKRSSSEAKVVQNGIPKKDVTKVAVITATSKAEDDIPRKDASPVNVPTDNQLIAD